MYNIPILLCFFFVFQKSRNDVVRLCICVPLRESCSSICTESTHLRYRPGIFGTHVGLRLAYRRHVYFKRVRIHCISERDERESNLPYQMTSTWMYTWCTFLTSSEQYNRIRLCVFKLLKKLRFSIVLPHTTIRKRLAVFLKHLSYESYGFCV